ncbi:MAG TPA: undecaprenyl-diphosphate phosphatase [Thermodesulfobacteriota bacterium]|nr:undecaprenyl-diphosphate phosphatase [Thermodesulfobacteriota bacterium]
MTILQAVILGLAQGLGEFLPISSSAHLVLIPWLFRWTDPGLTFDVALHVGTLVAVVLYFWKDWWELIIKGFTDARSLKGRLFWYLVVATVPGAIGGFLLEKKAETVFRSPILIAMMLIFMGILLYWADRRSTKKMEMSKITFTTSLLIGISQVLAIIPGVSRSGITMTTGLLTGLTREGAARFSFLLSTPIILGAAMVKLPGVVSNPSVITADFIIGMLVSCITGIASIGFLLRYVQTKDFLPFAWYRFILGALVIIVTLVRL